MAKTKHIKLKILVLTLALLCAGALALNGTFATRVEYSGTAPTTSVMASNYDVTLQAYSKSNQWVAMITKAGPVADANYTQDMFWCPGRTEIIYLKVENNEAFPVDLTLSMDINTSEEAQEKPDEYKLVDVLSYAIQPIGPNNTLPDNWKAFVAGSIGQTDTKLKSSNNSYTLQSKIMLAPTDSHYLAIAIHMAEDASNEYQNQKMDLKFSMTIDADNEPGSAPTPG